jgi:hypothetical protein
VSRRSVGVGLAITAVGGSAWAHGEVDVDRSSTARRSERRADESSETRGPEESPSKDAEGEKRFDVGLDLVLGWGKVPFAVQNLPSTGNRAITYTYRDAAPSDVQSFLLSASGLIAKRLAVGVRLPVTFAAFYPSGSASRSSTSLGNLDLDAEYRLLGVAETNPLSLFVSLSIALPTAQGDEIPPDLVNRNASDVDQNAYDRFSLNRAATFSRGDEEGALFTPKRLGLAPAISLSYRRGLLSIAPSLKVENLVSTSNSLSAPYIGEVVPVLRLGYRVHRAVELALRAWAVVRFAAPSGDRATTVAVEPRISLRFGSIQPYAGVVLPLTGLPFDGSFFGVRLGVAAAF